jgi:hypothetical protein
MRKRMMPSASLSERDTGVRGLLLLVHIVQCTLSSAHSSSEVQYMHSACWLCSPTSARCMLYHSSQAMAMM